MMLERMLVQLPEDIVADEDGLGAIAHTISHLESISDDAAEVVTEWLGAPPVLTEGRKHLLKETLAEWRRIVRKAAAMDGYTAVRDSTAAVSHDQEDGSKADSSGAEVVCAGCCSDDRD